MKVMTILGTRPEIIRLSQVIPKLDKACHHVLVHTGQSYDRNMSEVFFEELQIRKPDYYISVKAQTFAKQIARILTGIEEILLKESPDRVLVLGDTNSALSAFIAKRLGILVFHMEAGNRCYDDAVPEEVNRRAIDHCSDVFMPYTERSRNNLFAEGVHSNRIFVTGNPMFEILNNTPAESDILQTLNIVDKGYFLVTLHRQENVDIKERLQFIIYALSYLGVKYSMPVIFSCHPRTRKMLKKTGIGQEGITIHVPFGFLDFLTLERHARCVLTDSGTVQEECCLLKVPCVTVRDTTERPETVECGSNVLSGVDPRYIQACTDFVLGQDTNWRPPAEYLIPNVSDRVVRIVTSYLHGG